MNFFEEQRKAKRNTAIMVACFVCCYILTGAILASVGSLGLVWLVGVHYAAIQKTFLVIFGLFFLYSICVILMRAWDMKNPIHFFAHASGNCHKLKPGENFYQRRLHNIVEEMSIASGVPKPSVYIMQGDRSINAFAVGYDFYSAGIFVTEGTLVGLNREELQAVIGHEFSHILNGDMRSNTFLVSMMEGLEMIYNTSFEVLGDRPSARTSPALAFLILVIGGVGYIGWFFSMVIKAGFSRQKEYLADASSVQFTRNKQGMISTLRKIALLETRDMAHSTGAPAQASHMTFFNIGKLGFLTASHPPIHKRIARIDPNYTKKLQSLEPARQKANWDKFFVFDGMKEDIAMGFADTVHADNMTTHQEELRVKRELDLPLLAKADDFVFKVGNPSENSLLLGHVLSGLAQTLAKKEERAETLILAGVLSLDETKIKNQTACIERIFGHDVLNDVMLAFRDIKSYSAMTRFSLLVNTLDRCMELSPEDLRLLYMCLDNIFIVHDNYSSFERANLMAAKIHIRYLTMPQGKRFGTWSVHSAKQHISDALWLLSQQTKAPAAAYRRGMRSLRLPESPPMKLASWNVFEQKMIQLNNLSIEHKQQFIKACAEIICHDMVYTPQEIALLQFVCFSIHCPIPPLFVLPKNLSIQ